MHINSYYAASNATLRPHEALTSAIVTQTCVIGAGFAGLTTARELALRGHDVVLIDANLVGWGASGRNGGFVSAGFARSSGSIAAVTGRPTAKRLYELSALGRDYISDTITGLKRDDIILGKGWLKLLRHKNVADLKVMRDEIPGEHGAVMEMITGSGLSKYVRSDRYHSALLDENAFHIEPLRYAQLLANDVIANGGFIFEKTRCVGLDKNQTGSGTKWTVITQNGQIDAQNVVLATSSYGGPHHKMNRAILPVATYVVSSEACGSILDTIIPFTGCISDTRRSGDYYRTVGHGEERRLIWGGRITTFRTQPKRLAQMLKRDIVNVYPQLEEVKIEHAWSGLMGYALHQMPIIGLLDDKLWVASAFGGQGLNTSAMAGLLVSSAICEDDRRYKLFGDFGVGWSGGLAGRLATQLEYWRLQYLDRRDEKNE